MRNTIIVPDTSSQSEDVFLLNGESTVQHLTIKDFYALIHTISSPSSQTDNYFGGAVSTDGIHVIIGAPRHDTPASFSGIAYIFNIATGNLVHTLANPGAAPSSDFFGAAVSLDGNYAVVGAYNTGFYSGTVYLFDVTTGDLVLTWDNPNIDNILSIPGRGVADWFGTSVSLSGNTIMAAGGDNGGTTFIASIIEPITTSTLHYAFRFAPNTVISTRSPYVQNVTVITHGSVTSVSDPRGFEEGDAGGGAYIDGADVESASNEASMLFHSVTFITPGADAVTMTNGVRVEWLNSFTYFANRGLYAVDGVTGHLSTDGSTINYGAEIRSIGSANVYGNYGAVADGADTIMYLIQHNFGYIGAGKYVDNDPSRAIQANEVVESNLGKIYYSSTDHLGTFRVGDQFFIDFETGSTSVDIDTLTAGSLNGLVIKTGVDQTFITGAKVETGNIRFTNNNLDSLSGNLIITSPTAINFLDNVNIANDLSVSGNLAFDGNLNLLGNQTTDTLTFNVDFDQNFNPKLDSRYTLGTAVKEWNNIWLSKASIGDIEVSDNIITTTLSNANLDLRANGTGEIVVPSNNVQIDNNLTVTNATDLQSTTIVGTLTQTGNTVISNDATITGATEITENVTVGAAAQLEEINIDGNVITTTTSNTDLELRASSTGNILIPNNNVQIDTNLDADNIFTNDNINITFQTEFNKADVSSIDISQNYIETNVIDTDLELRATGNILIPNNNVQINNNLAVDGTTNLIDLFTNSFVMSNDLSIAENFNTINLTVETLTIGSQAQFEEINIDGNVITTTTSNANLELRASGTGNILIPNQDTVIDNNIDIQGDVYTSDMSVAQQVEAVTFETGTINISTNIITTDVSDADLELRANGIGEILVSNNNVQVNNNLNVNDTSNLQNINITGTLSHTENRIQFGNYSITNDILISQDLSIGAAAQFEEINISGNVITTITSNTDLELRANSTGNILIPNNDTRIINNLTADTLNAATININNTFALENLNSSTDIEIFDNVIRTTNSNSNLELRAAGSGSVYLEQSYFSGLIIGTDSTDLTFDVTENLNIIGTGALQLLNGVTAQRENALGDIRFNTSNNLFEGTSNSAIAFGGVYSTNRLTSLTADPTNNTLLLKINNTQVGAVNSGGIELHGLQVDDILVNSSTIATNVSNSDLEFSADGLGNILIGDFDFNTNVITNTSATDANFKFRGTNTHLVVFAGNHAVRFPAGTTAERPVSPQLGLTRQNTDDDVLETWDGEQWIPSAGLAESISADTMEDLSLAQTLIYG
jgi:cytoskeletal protein CcmA (bactofilin family)